MYAAVSFVGGRFYQVGAKGKALFGLRIVPKPTKSANPGEHVITPQFLPACDIPLRRLQVPTKSPATIAAAQTTDFLIFFEQFLKPAGRSSHHAFPSMPMTKTHTAILLNIQNSHKNSTVKILPSFSSEILKPF